MSKKNPVWAYGLPAALLLMAPFDLLTSLAMDIYLPVVPTMPEKLNTSPALIQLTLSLYMVLLGAGQIVFGPLSDRIGRRPVLLGGAMLFAATSFGLAVATTGAMFLGLRLLQAIGASAALVATFATVRDVYAERPEGTVIYSLFSAMLAFVPALGPILGALIADQGGWRAVFIALGLLTLPAVANAFVRWHETRPAATTQSHPDILPILHSLAFWTYTLAFSTAMGSFFVFFSTAPRVLIARAGYSELVFSLAFGTVAGIMIVTTRFARRFVIRWGIPGCTKRGMTLILAAAVLFGLGQAFAEPSFVTFILPMWVAAIGIVFTGAVAANGALADFGDRAGTAVALYFCIESLIVGIAGTLAVLAFDGDTAWPLVAYMVVTATIVMMALTLGRRRQNQSQ
ncbi:MAG TPA: CmlA/FloR family chloramphenicol efflux MFS transporter [Mesorhizobium sp.]|jgi:DHA1 family florfenicol/chloramphenicol resistance protein-like MFS transporter|uniref:CmlA/FloR family chloramphenicol efflux MFS transporter n=1 Tax=Mesorhizobium sp. TaxID=1871066 RepID=UPI002DDCE72C|nr:CmlA/FloR family chloramphenicol efflux MFS transporter [Mesorhizobium sp.]HEV2506854.1 CmlA/FloR family chloramphenicol efflux MFS transporter [Mesorhizobium sp.]